MLNIIFTTNVLRLMQERGMTKTELSTRSGISKAYVSSLCAGKANPSLETANCVAQALGTTLVDLIHTNDLEGDFQLDASHNKRHIVPLGFERVTVTVTKAQAHIIRKWELDALEKIKKTQE